MTGTEENTTADDPSRDIVGVREVSVFPVRLFLNSHYLLFLVLLPTHRTHRTTRSRHGSWGIFRQHGDRLGCGRFLPGVCPGVDGKHQRGHDERTDTPTLRLGLYFLCHQ